MQTVETADGAALPKTLVIIPAFNEERNIGAVIGQVRAAAPSADIVVVDDCSADATAAIAAASGARVLSHALNMGYGSTLQTGYTYALARGYAVVVQLDGDGQHDPRYVPELVRELAAGGADVIVGSRYVTETGYRAAPARRAGIRFFSFLILLITRKKVWDPVSGFRAMRRRILPLLVSDEFPVDFPDADLIIMLHYAGFSLREYGMRMHPNREGKSMHNGFCGNLFYVFRMCLSILLIVISKKIQRSR